MAFPTVAESGGTGAAGLSHAVTLPDCAVGDLLIVVSTSGPGSATTTQTWTFDSATDKFTLLYDKAGEVSGTIRTISKYRIVAVGDSNIGGTGTLTVKLNGSRALHWSVMRIPANTWHGTTPPEYATAVWAGSGVAVNCPALTPSWGVDDTLWLITTCTYSQSSIHIDDANYAAFSGHGYALSGYRALRAATEDPGSFHAAATYWIANTLAVRPRSYVPRPPGVSFASTAVA